MSANLSLDFANTAEWHAGPEPEERLTSYALAADWAREHGILTGDQAARLVEEARTHPDLEEHALGRIIKMREAIYHLFSAVAHRRTPAEADLRILDAEAREAAAHLTLTVVAEADADVTPLASGAAGPAGLPSFEWKWAGVEGELTGFLWPIAWDATVLLTSDRLVQLRECAGDPCGWLFLDLSKNGSRRWCDMADCGNRAKARRYRERKKQAAAGTPGAVPAAGPAAGTGST